MGGATSRIVDAPSWAVKRQDGPNLDKVRTGKPNSGKRTLFTFIDWARMPKVNFWASNNRVFYSDKPIVQGIGRLARQFDNENARCAENRSCRL